MPSKNDDTGKKLTDPKEVCERWKQHNKHLFDEKDENTEKLNIVESEPQPVNEEIERAILS